MANTYDNQIRRLNKRLETVASSLGTTSFLYSRMKNIISSSLPRNAFTLTNGRIAIKRDKNLNLNQQALDFIETNFNKPANKLAAAKKLVRETGKALGRKIKTYSDYKKLAAEMNDISQRVSECLDWLYNFKADPKAKALSDELKGKQKSYAYLFDWVERVNQYLATKGAANQPAPPKNPFD